MTQPAAPVPPTRLSELVKSAQDHLNRAQGRLKAGDWAGHGHELRKLEEDLEALNS
jgi:hypothetical protein